jgi:quercetin dioxygenase-like cupin family protein
MQQMQADGLKPYLTSYGPSARDGVRSHGYGKVLYCVEGSVEVALPDLRQTLTLKPGDRLELPRGTRYGISVGARGADCLESAVGGAADSRTTVEVKSV